MPSAASSSQSATLALVTFTLFIMPPDISTEVNFLKPNQNLALPFEPMRTSLSLAYLAMTSLLNFSYPSDMDLSL